MNTNDVIEAAKEAKRFLKRVEDFRKRHVDKTYVFSSPESAALRRASMDLTRALAKMRRR